MIISLDKKEFSEGVGMVARFAERKSGTLPVLSGIALIAGDDGIKLRATNLETGIDIRIAGSIQEPGVVVLPAHILREMTASFSNTGVLLIEQHGDTVSLSSGSSTSRLKTLPSEDFPVLPLPDVATSEFTLPSTILISLVSSVAPFASQSTVRPELASILLSAEGGTIKAVATDSFRLAEKKIALTESSTPFSILIPAKNAIDIIQILPPEDIKIKLNEHQCTFYFNAGLVTTRLVGASYPDYTQIIPKSFIAEASVIKKDFEAALKRTAVFSDTFQKIRLAFNVPEKNIRLASQNTDTGEASEEIKGSVSGEGVELSFNHRYLLAPLPLISTESVTLYASGIGRALVLRGTGENSFLYLVMPMNQ